MKTLVVDIGEKYIKGVLFNDLLFAHCVKSKGIEDGELVNIKSLEECLGELLLFLENSYQQYISNIGFCFSFLDKLNKSFSKDGEILHLNSTTTKISEDLIKFLKQFCQKWQKEFLFTYFSPFVRSKSVIIDLGFSAIRIKNKNTVTIIPFGLNKADFLPVIFGDNTTLVQSSRSFLSKILNTILGEVNSNNISLCGSFGLIGFVETYFNNICQKNIFSIVPIESEIVSEYNSNIFFNCIDAYKTSLSQIQKTYVE